MGSLLRVISISLLFVPTLLLAGGQNKLLNAKEVMDTIFWKTVYPNGGNTFYCHEAFDGPSAAIGVDLIYQAKWVKDHLRCLTRSRCSKDPEYNRITADMHNMVPALKAVQLARRDVLFDTLGPESESVPKPSCTYRIMGQSMEPADDLKGDVARALLYMHKEYKLPMVGNTNLYIDWHFSDLPDEAEKSRNDRIEKVQGNRNPFIDNPDLAEELRISGRLQF